MDCEQDGFDTRGDGFVALRLRTEPREQCPRWIGSARRACWALLGAVLALGIVPPLAHGLILYDTSQTYLYTNNSAYMPSADVATNAYGAAPATVTLGAFAAGWQDPTDPFALAAYDGAWDLGINGTITTTIPFTITPAGPHDVSLVIDMIAYYDSPLYLTPTLSLSGTITNAGLITTTLDHVDPLFGGSWNHTTWSNVVVTLNDVGTLNVIITAGPNGGVVDALSVMSFATNFETVIPEPSTVALLGMGAGFVWFLRRGFASRQSPRP
ncbi:PEP-CTERM sorting domain-containing protein [bacterium]|nr:PEP-CTERM sorting domain-containing protein [bacterium]